MDDTMLSLPCRLLPLTSARAIVSFSYSLEPSWCSAPPYAPVGGPRLLGQLRQLQCRPLSIVRSSPPRTRSRATLQTWLPLRP